MTDLETIKELLARATKGSWDNTIYCKRDGSPIKTIADIEETVSGSASYSDRLELFGVTLDDKDEDGLATVICYTGNGPNAHNNAALIAAAPDIARAYLDAKEGWDGATKVGIEYQETIARLTAERDRLRKMVKDAYNAGFSEGMREYTSANGGTPWHDSKFRAALGKEG